MQSLDTLSVVDILRSIPDSVITIGADRQIIALNGPAESLTGVREADAVGRPCAAVLRCEICGTDRCPFDAAYAGGETVTNFNVALRDEAGQTTPVCINTSPLKDVRGAVAGVVETIRVVSHINRLIEEIRDQRNQARAVLDSIADGVLTADRDGRITSINRTARIVLGWDEAHVLGRPWDQVVEIQGNGEAPAIGEALASGTAVRGREVVLRGRGGGRVSASLTVGVFRNAEGEPLGSILTFRDLGEIERIAEVRRSRTPLAGIIGKSPRLRAIFDLVETVADSDSTVLLQGESGTGKGLFAQAIHQFSPRRGHPFVKVSCAALPEALLESELFGHEKGAFTGAVRAREGRFEMAHRGTIFLDEIGDLSPAMQVKLLRVLQEHEFERVGSNRTVKVDVRVIAATHRPLRHLMQEGKFREDLFYRLNVIPIHIPPLRERMEDVPLLAEHLLGRLSARGKGRGKHLSPRTLGILLRHTWPGNVRELENVLEHAVVCTEGPVIEPHALPESLLAAVQGTAEAPAAAQAGPSHGPLPTAGLRLTALDREGILLALEACGWRRAEAARRLRIERTTLWRHMRRLGIAPPA
jgi:PAS domain S-box-containing protein